MSLTPLAFQIIAKFDATTLERKLSRAQNDLTRWTTIILFEYLSYEDYGRPIREVLPAGYTIEAALSDAQTMNCLKSLLYIRNGCVLYTRRHLIDGTPTRYRQLVLKIPPSEDDEMPPLVPLGETPPPRLIQSARVRDHDNNESTLFPHEEPSVIEGDEDYEVMRPFPVNRTIWNPNDIWSGRI
jgi:hypothetical protein